MKVAARGAVALGAARGAVALLSGAALPLQSYINGRLAADLASPTLATTLSVAVSGLLLLASASASSGLACTGLRPWMFSSALLMPCYIAVLASAPRYVGIEMVFVAANAGQVRGDNLLESTIAALR